MKSSRTDRKGGPGGIAGIGDLRRPEEECGLFGIYGLSDAATHTALGLHALQHRGQEAAGIVAYDGEQFHSHRALGLVGDNFNAPEVMERLACHVAIGHVRYSTTGETVLIDDLYAIPKNVPFDFDQSFDKATGYRSRSMLTFPVTVQSFNAARKSGFFKWGST